MKKRIIGFVSLSISVIISFFAGAILTGRFMTKFLSKESELSQKHLTLYLMMNQWIKVHQEGKDIAHYLESNEYRDVAVYGMNYVGETLCNELQNSNIKIKYGIDKSKQGNYKNIEIISPDETLAYVDAIIVTSVVYYGEIKAMLASKVDCPVLSLEDILYKL